MEIRGFIIQFVNIFADLLVAAIFIRVIMSWIRPTGNRGKFFSFVFEITEPVLSFFRRIIPRLGMFDISPIIAFLVIDFARAIIVSLLM
ncbi:YggT family protein [Patescibacteria group bacterium]